MNKNLFIAVADNLSKIKAYEFADEFELDIVGESGYVDDASKEITDTNARTILCSQKLFDGDAKMLYHKLPTYIKNECDFFVISPTKNETIKLNRQSHTILHRKISIIEEALNKVAISKNLKGYSYFLQALEIILSTPTALFDITHNIYSPVAISHNTDIQNVEYDMRTAMNSSLIRCNPDILSEVFSNIIKLSIGIYLSKLSDYIIKSQY